MYGSKTTWGAGEYALMAQALKPASAPATPLSWLPHAAPTCSGSTPNLRSWPWHANAPPLLTPASALGDHRARRARGPARTQPR